LEQTTIEHIYPQNPTEENVDEELEDLKNTIGNLTILVPEDNRELGNDPFEQKKTEYERSSLFMNQELGAQANWEKANLLSRRDILVDIAKRVFRL
jgi:hypothetical protein